MPRKRKPNALDKINERGWVNGWHADMLQSASESTGRDQAALFAESIKNAQGFSVPAKAIGFKGKNILYCFRDGSTLSLPRPNFLRGKKT